MDVQPLPYIPKDTRLLKEYLQNAGIDLKAADDVLLRIYKIDQPHWKAASYFMDDVYMRKFVDYWIQGWSLKRGITLEWCSSLIVILREKKHAYLNLLQRYLVKGKAPPSPIVHTDMLNAQEIADIVLACPSILWHSNSAAWVEPLLWRVRNPWSYLILGSPKFIKKSLRISRKGAVLASILQAPQYLYIILKKAKPSDLYVYDAEGRSLLEMTCDNPYLFCELARAGAPRDGVRRLLFHAVRTGRISGQEFRRMRGAIGDRFYTGCFCC